MRCRVRKNFIAVVAPFKGRFNPAHYQHRSTGARCGRLPNGSGGPYEFTLTSSTGANPGSIYLKIVVFLRVDIDDFFYIPFRTQVAQAITGGFTGVIP